MIRLEARPHRSQLQSRLDREAVVSNVATMEVVSGEEESAETPLHDGLTFGPYNVSPIRGLHFDAADDTATS